MSRVTGFEAPEIDLLLADVASSQHELEGVVLSFGKQFLNAD